MPDSSAPETTRRQTMLRALAPTLTDTNPVIGVIDLDVIDTQLTQLRAAFSDLRPLHTVAVKAIPLLPVLARVAASGYGAEVASPGEFRLALAAGFPFERIVFDSPAKTRHDLVQALAQGVTINADNFSELDRIDQLIRGLASEQHRDTTSSIGLRINPQLGAGTITAMSTATPASKFGVALHDPGNRQAILTAFARYPWLTGLHVHSGSQGMSLDQSARGVKTVFDLAEDINQQSTTGHRHVTTIDIGGGLPVNYTSDSTHPSFADYRTTLQQAVPGLNAYSIITEFGRSIAAKAGTILAKVEYVKTAGNHRIAITHAGVQVATRTVYMPDQWPLRVLVATPAGELKTGDTLPHDIAGPACFSGDLIATNIPVPPIEEGDIVIIPDTGAYNFVNHYSYNSLPRIPIMGITGAPGTAPSIHILRQGQSLHDIVAESGEANLTQ